jgi:hypothetical protein
LWKNVPDRTITPLNLGGATTINSAIAQNSISASACTRIIQDRAGEACTDLQVKQKEVTMPDTLTITDDRTGKKYQIPIVNGTIKAMDLR